MDYKRLAFASGAALVALALWLAWLWQPERQVRLHTTTLLKAVERRNWEKFDFLLAESYSDRWGHDKEFVQTGSRQVFQQFAFLTIENAVTAVMLEGDSGRAVARVKISGQGGPVALFVMERVNGLAEPFTFAWRKRSGKPWDWELTSVEHPTLQVPNEPGF